MVQLIKCKPKAKAICYNPVQSSTIPNGAYHVKNRERPPIVIISEQTSFEF